MGEIPGFRVEPIADDETRFILADYTPEQREQYVGDEKEFVGDEVIIHPWDRGRFGREVAVEVRSVDFNGRVFENDEYIDYHQIGIFNRDRFIDMLLKAFPTELKDARK